MAVVDLISHSTCWVFTPHRAHEDQANKKSSRTLCGILTTKPNFSKRVRKKKKKKRKGKRNLWSNVKLKFKKKTSKPHAETQISMSQISCNTWAYSSLFFKNTECWQQYLAIWKRRWCKEGRVLERPYESLANWTLLRMCPVLSYRKGPNQEAQVVLVPAKVTPATSPAFESHHKVLSLLLR